MSRVLLITFAVMLACACNDPSGLSGASEESDGTPDDSESTRVKTGYEQSLERAREVEEQAREAVEEQRRRIEEDGGGG